MYIKVKDRAKAYGNKGKMAVSERQVLETKRSDLKATLDPNENASLGRVNKPMIQSELQEIEKRLLDDDSKVVRSKDKDGLLSKKAALETFIKENVPPLRIQKAREGTPEYDEALRWGRQATEPFVVDKCHEYQDICRRLDPHNPLAGDIEKVVGW